jgi:VWFA-related protein
MPNSTAGGVRVALFAVCAAFLIPSVAPLHAQQPGAQQAGGDTVIRSETRVVLVDAVAVDRKGKFARDLAQKDFRIWEDGKEQKITSFSLESSGVSPERPSKHYMVMYFDTASIGQGGQLTLRQQATRFVQGFASPDRFMSVVSYAAAGGLHVGQNFTTDGDALVKAINSIQATSAGTTTAAAAAAPARGGRGAPAPTTGGNEPFVVRDMLASLRSIAKTLATIRGRKALVVFSVNAQITGDVTQDLASTVAALNKANIAVYAVGSGSTAANDSGGAAASSASGGGRGGRGPSAEPAGTDLAASNQSLGRSLAEDTGGLTFVSTNDLAESLGRVAQEQDEYYLLGYTPLTDSAEGSCHDLRVKVDRGDLDVRARKSYCTSKPVDLLSGKPAGKDLEARAAGGAPGNIAAKMQLPWFYSAPNVARVNVAMDIVPPPMKFQKEKGKLHAEFDLAGVAYKPDGSVAARVSDAVKLEFDTQQQADAFLRAPYHYENQFDLAPGQYNFRMALSAGEQGFGKVETPLSVEPWNGQTLSMSGIALSHDARPAADLAAGLDVSLLEGMRPLVAKTTEVVPTGTPQFHSGERGFIYFEAYEPQLAALANAKPDAPLPLVGARIRVLDRATGQQKDDTGVKTIGSFMRPGNPVVPVISVLPTATLPPGAYKLEVSVMHQSGDLVVRTMDFDVN